MGPTESPGMHVLLVDDDWVILALMKEVFELHGIDAVLRESAREALELLARPDTAINLLVADMNMPGMTGIELIRRVRELGMRLPCVLASSHIDDVLEAEADGVEGVVVFDKSDNLPNMPAFLRDLVGRQGDG